MHNTFPAFELLLLLSGLMLDHRKDADDLFAPLRPHMGEFIASLKARGRDAG